MHRSIIYLKSHFRCYVSIQKENTFAIYLAHIMYFYNLKVRHIYHGQSIQKEKISIVFDLRLYFTLLTVYCIVYKDKHTYCKIYSYQHISINYMLTNETIRYEYPVSIYTEQPDFTVSKSLTLKGHHKTSVCFTGPYFCCPDIGFWRQICSSFPIHAQPGEEVIVSARTFFCVYYVLGRCIIA